MNALPASALHAPALSTALLLALAAAGANAADFSPSPAERSIAHARGNDLIASVSTTDGHRFDFVAEGDGVGIAEVAPAGTRSNLETLIAVRNASPLEVYLAIDPAHKGAPTRLVAAHDAWVRSSGRTDARVRKLSLDTGDALAGTSLTGGVSTASVDTGYDTDFCRHDTNYKPGDSQFTWWWYWTVGLTADFTAQQLYEYQNLNGTTGKVWYAGTSSARWLGACNGNTIYGFQNFEFDAQYRASNGTWQDAYHTQVAPYFWVKYYSYTAPQNWRVRLHEMTYNVMLNRIYGVAVAGNDPFVIGF